MPEALYQKLLHKPYPAHQYMDAQSIKWLQTELKTSRYSFSDFVEEYVKFPLNKIDINTDIFDSYNGLGIHGFRHQFRVMLYIWILTQMLHISITKESLIELLQAALYHDIMRINDNSDAEHGAKSARWIESQYQFIDKQIIDAVKKHNQPNGGDTSIYTALLKTADALDRYRLPKKEWWINMRFLELKVPVDKLEIFQYITCQTEAVAYMCHDSKSMKRKMLKWLKQEAII